MRLGKTYSDKRLEAACRRACSLGSYSYKSIESILKRNLDKEPLPNDQKNGAVATLPHHENVRGANYYQQDNSGREQHEQQAQSIQQDQNKTEEVKSC